MSIHRIDRSRADTNENFIVVWRRLFNFLKLEIFGAIFARQDGFHGIIRLGSVLLAVVGGSPVGDEQPCNENPQDRKEGPFEDAVDGHSLRSQEVCAASAGTFAPRISRQSIIANSAKKAGCNHLKAAS